MHVVNVIEKPQLVKVQEQIRVVKVIEKPKSVTVTQKLQVLNVISKPQVIKVATTGVRGPQGPSGGIGDLEVDGITIVGDGTSPSPLAVDNTALNAFLIPNNLGEIPTQVDRLEAQQNLGLHIIDGGTFT